MNRLAEILDEATLSGRAVPKLTDMVPLDVPAAYEVQRAGIERRRSRGERLIGVKMGFTSRAKMAQMGVDDVIWGLLTDTMLVESHLDTGGLIHPRIEPEIAFLLDRPVRTPSDAVAAVGGVAVGYEVIDSRYRDFDFTLADVIADNASACGFGHGPWRPLGDVGNVGLLMEIDGRPVASGSSAAILGDPLRSLTAAARLAQAAGIELQPGWVVLAGAATAAVPLPCGAHVRVSAAGLGHVEVTTR
ncbi:2-oxo-3-hexenedioate decarboxylase [Streptosporangium becharense]|uniref:2-oxo-3-hexenedioate decarboxylase n=1 Tax=Streptosporangium becharense TaxID=1816182 RepID=A0A7W9MJ42_9ACTN|nr:fumarylacetoacetate hydrolase family protein [Streptosporangium becharense]MBB2913268.1 2-oxo-3-hexenedioate decarboxylase [Streptosporangium becharense]MBB5822251.1 2-oxo-3-hexenedioate decarboxylase [Streptosporangium becharense]